MQLCDFTQGLLIVCCIVFEVVVVFDTDLSLGLCVPVAAVLFNVWQSLSDHLALSLLVVCSFLCSISHS